MCATPCMLWLCEIQDENLAWRCSTCEALSSVFDTTKQREEKQEVEKNCGEEGSGSFCILTVGTARLQAYQIHHPVDLEE